MWRINTDVPMFDPFLIRLKNSSSIKLQRQKYSIIHKKNPIVG